MPFPLFPTVGNNKTCANDRSCWMTDIAEKKLQGIVEYALCRHPKHMVPLYVASADQEARSGNGISTINTPHLRFSRWCWWRLLTLFQLVNVNTGALKDDRSFIFWVKQSKKMSLFDCFILQHVFPWLQRLYNCFLQFLTYHLYMHIFSSSNSSLKAVSHVTDKMK